MGWTVEIERPTYLELGITPRAGGEQWPAIGNEASGQQHPDVVFPN